MPAIPPVLARAIPNIRHHALKHWKYASVEMAPPLNPATWATAAGELIAMFSQKRFMNLTFGQALLNSMVYFEICCWFAVGELIGKHWAHKSLPYPLIAYTPLVLLGPWGTWSGYNTSKKINGQVVWPNENGEYVV